jgi:AcrR family transcriptional regulator
MSKKQALRSEETKRDILTAAKLLFSEKGYNTVSMREIAKKAGCSHTTIYIYFKDKEDLLEQLSIPTLKEMIQKFQAIILNPSLPAEYRLKEISRKYFHFCLKNRSLYTVFFIAHGTRVDEEHPELEINRVRIELFQWLQRALLNCLSINENDKQLLTYARIYFYILHGMVSTYLEETESIEALYEHIAPICDEAIKILLLGLQAKIKSRRDKA